mgnify:CR=1 FL=1
MAIKKLRLELDVEYDTDEVSEDQVDELMANMTYMVETAVGNGGITHDLPVTLESWATRVFCVIPHEEESE